MSRGGERDRFGVVPWKSPANCGTLDRELFEERLKQVSEVIDQYEAAHLSVQTRDEVEDAIRHLHEQNWVLMRATDEEQLVDRYECFLTWNHLWLFS